MNFFHYFFPNIQIYFLLSYEKNKKINIDKIKNLSKNKIENITMKNNVSIELLEFYLNIEKDNYIFEFEIVINNKVFILNVDKIKKGINFVFNQTIINKKTKKRIKLNCFDINEEFDIYYNHFKNNDIESLINL